MRRESSVIWICFRIVKEKSSEPKEDFQRSFSFFGVKFFFALELARLDLNRFLDTTMG